MIKGFEKLSAIDYPGKTCSIIFLGGCNFSCPFCHNPDLVKGFEKFDDIPEEKIFKLLRKRRKWIDGVCVSGGEPCIHKELPALLKKIRKEGFLVKLDTNGSNPVMLEKILKNGLVDYIAMDIKSPLEKYSEVVGNKINIRDIKKSIKLIMNSGIEYEFRTTAVPGIFSTKDAEKIGKMLKGANRYFIQGFKAGNNLDKEFSKKGTFSEKELEEFAGIIRKYIKEVGVRT